VGARLRGPRLAALQVEVTSRCDLACVTCPRTVLGRGWRSHHMPWPVFERVARAFPHAELVHLQGWGEPLLHPRFLDMVRAGKAARCRVGFTTSGMRLDGKTADGILDAGADLVAVSLAGATAATHEAIRVRSDFARVVANVRALLARRAARGRRRPTVELFFLMTTANLHELPAAVDLAASIGVDALVATNLDYVVTAAHDALRSFGPGPATTEAAALVEAARTRARTIGLRFVAYPLEPAEVAVCDANPLGISFVCADGSVSPCAWLGLVGQSTVPRCVAGRPVDVPRACFGNVVDADIVDLWRGPGYTAFRGSFADRRRALLARTLAAAAEPRGDGPVLPPPPAACASCPKLRGH
jgi:MoaA/NifB/PqqE/SkfB family radical SAM enzyme